MITRALARIDAKGWVGEGHTEKLNIGKLVGNRKEKSEERMSHLPCGIQRAHASPDFAPTGPGGPSSTNHSLRARSPSPLPHLQDIHPFLVYILEIVLHDSS